jgi:MFS family permease
VPLIFAFALLQGAGIGAMSILRPVLTAEVLGERGFGTIAGALSVAPLFGAAAAPVLGAALLAQGGAGALIAAALAIAAVSLALALSLTRRQPYG